MKLFLKNHPAKIRPAARPLKPLGRRLALLGAFGLCAAAHAQSSRSTLADVGVVNSSVSPYIGALDADSSDSGASVSASASQTFTGLDRNGDSQSMTFSGSVLASADYGQLHSSATGQVSNTYYNAANPVYYNSTDGTYHSNGSPDGLVSIGFASFSDTLQFGGALQAGYQARYIFHAEGTNSGYGALADLSVTIAGHNEAFFAADAGHYSADWATQSYAINGTTPQSIMVQFSDQFVLNTQDVADGSAFSGSSNFADTVTLSGIEIVDANGNPVSGVTFTADSGTAYSAVPEPATFGSASLALLLAGARQLRRRRRTARSV